METIRLEKQTFKKFIIEILCNRIFERLPRNVVLDITHPRMPLGMAKIMTMNRSFQEKRDEYVDVKNYFCKFFKDANICIMSTHAHDPSIEDARSMIFELKSRCYNPKAVFFSSGYDDKARSMSLLDWQERLWVHNPQCQNEQLFINQIRTCAE